MSSDQGAEDVRYGLLIACFGLTVALMVAESPVRIRPGQPRTLWLINDGEQQPAEHGHVLVELDALLLADGRVLDRPV